MNAHHDFLSLHMMIRLLLRRVRRFSFKKQSRQKRLWSDKESLRGIAESERNESLCNRDVLDVREPILPCGRSACTCWPLLPVDVFIMTSCPRPDRQSMAGGQRQTWPFGPSSSDGASTSACNRCDRAEEVAMMRETFSCGYARGTAHSGSDGRNLLRSNH